MNAIVSFKTLCVTGMSVIRKECNPLPLLPVLVLVVITMSVNEEVGRSECSFIAVIGSNNPILPVSLFHALSK